MQSVALSPAYKHDRSYVSGGLAGNLILTVGGVAGKSATSNTSGAAAATAGWLGAIGIGSHNGTDKVLHSGEGSISTIKWSLGGNYLAWVNERGVKIMRTNLHLESGETDFAWAKPSHIDHPNRPEWKDMAGVWKARAEWIDEDGLELDDEDDDPSPMSSKKNEDNADTRSIRSIASLQTPKKNRRREKLIVGWGDTIWMIHVHPGARSAGREGVIRKMGKVEVVTMQVKFPPFTRTLLMWKLSLRTDCIISGISLYTPNLLLVLAYVTPDNNHAQDTAASQSTPRRGIHRRQNALQPEMRIIDIETKEEVCIADTLKVSRFESLSATDYHLGVLPVIRASAKSTTLRGALDVFSGIGGTIWDATMYPTKLLGSAATDATLYSAQLFSSAASMRSVGGGSEKNPSSNATSARSSDAVSTPFKAGQGPHPALLTRGMKIFIQSPYDCVLATKPTRADHLKWLVEHEKYEEAWTLIDTRPEVAGGLPDRTPTASTPGTPTKVQGSLVDFFDDSSQSTLSGSRNLHSRAERDKGHIGQKWIQQLINKDDWTTAGQVCGKVLKTSSSWEHWAWIFAGAGKHTDISPYIPTKHLRPPLSSTVYEIMLQPCISEDRPRLGELLDRWPSDLFDTGSIISAMETQLKFGETRVDTVEDGIKGRDWRILEEGLAKLYLANGQSRDALRCYIRLQDADTALALIRTQNLVDAVADDIPGLIQIRIPKGEQEEASLSALEEGSSKPIRLLVSEAHHGVVTPETVINQLQNKKGMKPYLFFYFRALWNGDTIDDPTINKRSIRDATTHHLATEGKSLVNDYADTALSLFAEYDRDLLFTFLKLSQSYTLSLASSICEKRNYVSELVYLYAKEGRMKKALFVIIEKLDDVSQAITFAKEQNDPDLWNDLLNYSMNKPVFIRALLEEVGTSIDPITLVRRIPEGLEIEGLRNSLTRMIKEYELQDSISEGVARVLRGEVAAGMESLRAGQKRGIKFDILAGNKKPNHVANHKARRRIPVNHVKVGHCAGCGEVFIDEGMLLFTVFYS